MSFTQDRFNEVFKANEFDITIKCKKCGSTNIDCRLSPGIVYSEYTSQSAEAEIWCRDCNNTASTYEGDWN